MEVREASVGYLSTLIDTVPVGYKQTEVGVIPEDWNIHLLGVIGKFKNGLNKGSEAFGHGTPFINLMDVFGIDSIASTEHLGLVACSRFEQNAYGLRRGDVVFVRSSVKPSGVGLTALIEKDLPETVYSGFLIRFRDAGFIQDNFKKFCFYESRFRRAIVDSSSVSANTNINQGSLQNLSIPLPPTKAEQEVIAEALSDADALIESLQQLITKKRQIKQGTMQDLLTGQQRLPGFSGEWKRCRLDSLADIRSGGTPSTTRTELWGGDIPWCTPTDITALNGSKYLSATERTITREGLTSSSAELITANALVMTSRATIGECAINQVPLCTNQGFKNFIPFAECDVEFLFYLLQTKKQDFVGLCGGSTFLEIGKKQLAIFEVKIPQKRAEQTAIATVLSDMDSEIADLQTRLAKIRDLKQGMMQALLTGRIRLPLDAVSETARDPSLAALARKV